MLPLLVIVVCIGLAAYVLLRLNRLQTATSILLTLLTTALVAGTLLLPDDLLIAERLGRHFVTTLTLALLLVVFGALLLRDLNGQQPRWWWSGGMVWAGVIALVGLSAPSFNVGTRDWLLYLLRAPEAGGVIVLAGFVVASALLPGWTLVAHDRASLPEIGNRALLWLFQTIAILSGAALILSGVSLLMQAGILALMLGTAGATYMHLQRSAFDLPSRLRFLAHLLVTIVVTGLLIALAVWAAGWLGLYEQAQALLLIAVFGVMMALLYIPLRGAVEFIFRRFSLPPADPTAAARKYSQQITRSLDLRQLAQTVGETLTEVMAVRRAGLMLVNAPNIEHETVTLRFLPGVAAKETRAKLASSSPIYRHWQDNRAPLTQYDIEVKPEFTSTAQGERDFFREAGMSAYAPILVDEVLIGVLVCGAKRDDTLYTQADLDLLATMADQTGIALRNARLVADLRQVNDNSQVLNRGLAAAKEQMEKLDAVKTDFITIASHELRTPLAQIKGYIELANALNSQGFLDQDRLSEHLENMRKAGDRIEELIAAMLDVSQLDLKSMDLRFAESSLESILRMSVEPLADVAKQRKLSLVVRGLRGLPMIEADMTRLVQAFRNVLVNAIKFTPDGGRIDVGAERKPATDDAPERIVVTIADTGVGIDKENLELIFNKFYRTTDPSLHSSGTYKFMGAGPGLGLTIARGIIQGHGGRIWVESPGHDMEACPGSIFTIELPLQPPKDTRHAMTFAHGDNGYDAVMMDTTVVGRAGNE
jgi:signal transduction histidine kinase